MSYTYATFVDALASLLAVDDIADADFVAQLPTIIQNAELRCYRELDLVSASVAVNGTMTANSRYFTLPTGSGHIIVVDAINVFDAASVRHYMLPSTRDVLDVLWPSETAPAASSIPKHFARIDDTRVLVGPPAGAAWTAEVIGTIRPDALSAVNTTTFLSTYIPDLFITAAMVFATGGLLKNYGAQADDPRQAVSWESQYQALLSSAKTEELRKSYINANSSLPASAKA
jgi:hypothetical protein